MLDKAFAQRRSCRRRSCKRSLRRSRTGARVDARSGARAQVCALARASTRTDVREGASTGARAGAGGEADPKDYLLLLRILPSNTLHYVADSKLRERQHETRMRALHGGHLLDIHWTYIGHTLDITLDIGKHRDSRV